MYTDVDLLWPDVLLAKELYNGGAFTYMLKAGTNITNKWLCKHVLAITNKYYPTKLVLVLAKAVLWTVFDHEAKSLC